MSTSTVRLLIVGDADNAARALGRFDRSLSGVGRTAKVVSGVLVGSFGAGIVYAVKKAADLETQLNTFQATSKATARQMDQVGKLAKRLGNDFKLPGVSALDAANALTELAKGGLSVRDAMKAARATLQLATAAQVSHARAAEIVADQLNAFRLSGEKAAHVADLLANAANASTAEIDEMAMALQQSATVAVQAGLSIDQTTTALTLMANAGLKSSDAGTSLKTFLISLMAPTETAGKALKKLNIDLRDQEGRMRPLPALIAEFRKETKGLSDAQRDAALKTIFGTDAIRAANILLGVTPKKWKAVTGAVTEAGGAQRLAEARTKGFNGALKAFRSAAETAAITLGQKLLPKLTDLFEVLADLASAKGLGDLWDKLFGGMTKPKVVKPKVELDFTGTKIVGGPRELLGMLDPKTGQRRTRVAIPIDLKTNRAEIQALNALMANLEKARGAKFDSPGSGLVEKSGLVDRLRRAITDAWNGVNWSAVWGKVFDAAGEFGKKMLEAGKNIVTGALEGDWDKVGQAAALAIVGALATRKVLGKLGITGALGTIFGLGGKAIGGLGGRGVVPVFVTNPGFSGPGGGTPVPAPGGKGSWIKNLVKWSVVGAVVGAAVSSGPNDKAFGKLPFGQGPNLRDMWNWWGRPGATRAASMPQSSLPPSRISGAAAGPFLSLANSTQDFEAAAKSAERTGRGSFQRIAQAAAVAADAIRGIKPRTVNVKAVTNPKAVKGLQDAIAATSGKTVQVKAAVEMGNLREFAAMLASLPREKAIALRTFSSGPQTRASGGAIAGGQGAGDVVPALLSPGEVVLNDQQQRMIGPDLLRRVLEQTGAPLDGFRFARGKRARSVPKVIGAARRVLEAVEDVNQRQSNLDRAYGQMARNFARTQETYIVSDADGNESRDEAAISTRLGEIDQLISSREEMLALIDEEKRQLQLAVKRLNDAIERLMFEIQKARENAEAERAQAVALARKIAAERKKKTPDEKKIGRWDRERQTHLTYAGRHDNRARTLQGQLAEMRAGKEAARFDLDNVIGFDRKDVELDIADLRQERTDVQDAKATARPAAAAATGLDQAQLAELGRLRLALGIQDVQIPLIGSFARGALQVPSTGLAMVHAGERIIPANERDTGTGGGGTIVLHLNLSGGLEMLGDFVDARVTGPGADRVAVVVGQRADTLRREGRL